MSLHIKGKYNVAHVMIDEIDDTTHEQIQSFVNNRSFAGGNIAIMPDCHAGAGSCIGFTMPIGERIIPDVVGVDIGCGMLSCNFGQIKLDVEALDEFIKKNIPSGFAINSIAVEDTLSKGAPNHVRRFDELADSLGVDKDRVAKSIGSLGGGNHFIEAGYSESGNLWVTTHSGSRNLGLQIAKYHGNIAKKLCDKWGADTQGIPFLLTDSSEGRAYIWHQTLGVTFAHHNRNEIMRRIVEYLKVEPLQEIESVHNFIDDEGIIRKGATSAKKDELLIIPFNMRDGLAVCKGKGNPKYNWSAPHGAGRLMSRTKARDSLDVAEFQDTMKQAGVYTTTATEGTLDEAPDAYKDKDIILQNISETVDIVEFIKPVYNFKAGSETQERRRKDAKETLVAKGV